MRKILNRIAAWFVDFFEAMAAHPGAQVSGFEVFGGPMFWIPVDRQEHG